MDAAIGDSGRQSGSASQPFLAADVGGTHARVALVQASRVDSRVLDVLAYRAFRCADFSSLTDLLRAFLRHESGVAVRRCVLACAGQLTHGEVTIHDNLAWPIRLSEVRLTLGFDEVAVLNDFEALGYALDDAGSVPSRLLCGPDTRVAGPMLIVGPGTGLGASVRLPGPPEQVLATEAGQIDLAPQTTCEREVLARLAPAGGYVPYEQVVSGPGVLVLYRALCELHGASAALATPEAVTVAAWAGADRHAVAAVDMFCALLGSFAGNLAMVCMARGGVYLAGGFLASMFDLLARSRFAERFVHGRSVRNFLEQVPVRVLEPGRYGVRGAARWYLRKLTGALPASLRAVECAAGS